VLVARAGNTDLGVLALVALLPQRCDEALDEVLHALHVALADR